MALTGDRFAEWIPMYWSIALAIGFLGSVLYYRHRGRTTGVEGRIWPAALVGLLTFVAMLTSSSTALRSSLLGRFFGWFPVLILEGRGLEPLVFISAGLVVLAALERSRSLAGFAALFLAVSLTANLYDVENMVFRLGWNLPAGAGYLPNVLFPGLVLLIGGTALWWADHRALRRTGQTT
jgi:hypothetical protein